MHDFHFLRSYLSLDARVKYLVCAVKLWMKLNNFADRHLFTTYAQIWMVLFFLMQPEIAVVPTVLKLRLMLPVQQQVFDIEGEYRVFDTIYFVSQQYRIRSVEIHPTRE